MADFVQRGLGELCIRPGVGECVTGSGHERIIGGILEPDDCRLDQTAAVPVSARIADGAAAGGIEVSPADLDV